MARSGRPADPKESKRAKGETRPSRLAVVTADVIEFSAVERVPDPPEWLNVDGQDLWATMAPMLFAQKVLAQADLHALAHLCQLHGDIIDCYRRRVQVPAATLSQLRMYFSEFGMTPSSRARVPHAGGKTENSFSRNGKKETG